MAPDAPAPAAEAPAAEAPPSPDERALAEALALLARGDFRGARARAESLRRSAASEEVRAGAAELVARLRIDPAVYAVLAGCALLFALAAWLTL